MTTLTPILGHSPRGDRSLRAFASRSASVVVCVLIVIVKVTFTRTNTVAKRIGFVENIVWIPGEGLVPDRAILRLGCCLFVSFEPIESPKKRSVSRRNGRIAKTQCPAPTRVFVGLPA